MSQFDQHQTPPQVYPPPTTAYPPPGEAYVAPPAPMGYPVNDDGVAAPYQQSVPMETKSRGDGFWKGCCAALCCCCVLDMCF
ncbi:putative cysteine-rich and transmembrane domain-containing protein WIH1/2 [Dioscorea sansibarensis]